MHSLNLKTLTIDIIRAALKNYISEIKSLKPLGFKKLFNKHEAHLEAMRDARPALATEDTLLANLWKEKY